ncbi:hypothetical protein CLAIMM_03419 [Cladophialophora immunda]|nr:hypothetical protein CLAIMM_03419 [Cladophialophora immunda]
MRVPQVTSLLALIFTPLCASHFIILTPPPLGNNINNEDQSPCGGFSPSSSDNITDFHVEGDAIGLTSLHAQSYFAYRGLLGTSLSAPNWTVLIPTVEEFGLNSFCQPALAVPTSWAGSPGLLQVIQDAEDGVHYQCMHVNFVAGTGTPPSTCSNSSGVSAQYADDPTFDSIEGVATLLEPEIAYECLSSVPIIQEDAEALVGSLRGYLEMQSTLDYLAAPTTGWLFPPVDIIDMLGQIRQKIANYEYSSEYDLQVDLHTMTLLGKDGHLTTKGPMLTALTFHRLQPANYLVSLSKDGIQDPSIYLLRDRYYPGDFYEPRLRSGEGFSAITKINNLDVQEYLQVESLTGTSQDLYALYNGMMYPYMQFDGPEFYPGPYTNFTFQNGSTKSFKNYASWGDNNLTGIADGYSMYERFLEIANLWDDSGSSAARARRQVKRQTFAPAQASDDAGAIMGYWDDGLPSDVAVVVISSFAPDDSGARNFDSVDHYYGPYREGPGYFTSYFQENYTNNEYSLIDHSDMNITQVRPGAEWPFRPENMIILTDGICASSCSIFVENLKNKFRVMSIVVGGRPQTGPMQTVGGVRGSRLFPYDHLANLSIAYADQTTAYPEFADPEFEDWDYGPAVRFGEGLSVNGFNAYRIGEPHNIPLHFAYEAADCRIWYTPEMIEDDRVLWNRVAELAFTKRAGYVIESPYCVEGSTKHPTSISGGVRQGDLGPQTPPENAFPHYTGWIVNGTKITQENLGRAHGVGPGADQSSDDNTRVDPMALENFKALCSQYITEDQWFLKLMCLNIQ